ncbi:MAG: pseudouridine synthase, partial [Phycisphaerae bacterium]
HHARPPPIEVLHADADLVVVNKPARLPVVTLDADEDCVAAQLGRLMKCDAATFRIVDAMDSDVSGLMAMARTALSEKVLVRQFKSGAMERRYLAIVRAAPFEPDGRIEIAIGSDRYRRGLMRIGGGKARDAVTEWTLRERFTGFALLECRPLRERGDQVRLHLQAAGMPLAVDPDYGGNRALLLSSFKPGYRPSRRHGERPLIARISLHAASLAFNHPTSGTSCRFEAAPPKDFRAALNQLDKHGRIGCPPPQ